MSAGGKQREGPELRCHSHWADPLPPRSLEAALRGSFLPPAPSGSSGGASWLLPERAMLSLLSSDMLWGAHQSLGSSQPCRDSPSLQPSPHLQRRKLRLREGRLMPTVTQPSAKAASAKARRLAPLSSPPRAPGSLVHALYSLSKSLLSPAQSWVRSAGKPSSRVALPCCPWGHPLPPTSRHLCDAPGFC